MKKFLENNYLKIIIAILSFVTIVSILNASNDSLIYDEDAHIPAAYSYLTQHDIRLNPEHPPLLKDLAAIPLVFMHPNFDTSQSFWTTDNADESQWNAGKNFLFQSGNDPDKIIFYSRLSTIVLSLVLGLFIFKWVNELAGTLAGLFALTLYAFDPNILGHNHFMTTDIGIAAFLTFSFYYFLRFIKDPAWKNAIIAGVFIGLAQLAKFSAVISLPVFVIILLIYPLVKKHKDATIKKSATFTKYIWRGMIMFFVAIFIIYIVYWFNTYNMPQAKLIEIMDHYFRQNDPRLTTIYARKFIAYINNFPILSPMADYIFGVFRVFQRVAGGNVIYFMGQISSDGYLSYFPILFLIKEPLLILFTILLAITLAFKTIIRSHIRASQEKITRPLFESCKNYLRLDIVQFTLLLFMAIYIFTSITGRLNIGIRHLFPIFPFMYILTATTIFRYIRKKKDQHHKYFYYTITSLVAILLIIRTVLAYPYYTSYFNSLAGGPMNGYTKATDSNADWGQDLKRLAIFLNDHPEISKVKIDYFGMAEMDYYINGRYEKWWAAKRPIETGWYAISTEFLEQGIYDRSLSDEQSYHWLINRKPLYQIGTSILIFYVDNNDGHIR